MQVIIKSFIMKQVALKEKKKDRENSSKGVGSL